MTSLSRVQIITTFLLLFQEVTVFLKIAKNSYTYKIMAEDLELNNKWMHL